MNRHHKPQIREGWVCHSYNLMGVVCYGSYAVNHHVFCNRCHCYVKNKPKGGRNEKKEQSKST